jgi:hypothetical protein
LGLDKAKDFEEFREKYLSASAEYTYNGDKQELYEDVYGKITNTCHAEE